VATDPTWSVKTPAERELYDLQMQELGQSAGSGVDYNSSVSPNWGLAITIPNPDSAAGNPSETTLNFVYDTDGNLVPYPNAKPATYTSLTSGSPGNPQAGSGLFPVIPLPGFLGSGVLGGINWNFGGIPWWVWALIGVGVVVVLDRD
jgi:hypothetical protein